MGRGVEEPFRDLDLTYTEMANISSKARLSVTFLTQICRHLIRISVSFGSQGGRCREGIRRQGPDQTLRAPRRAHEEDDGMLLPREHAAASEHHQRPRARRRCSISAGPDYYDGVDS